MEKENTISACLVVYNEEKVIERCLESIKDVVDEIIIVHDGECADRTLEIAKKYTDRIFVKEHVGEAEPHRVFSFAEAKGEWILQIDADEFLSDEARENLRELVKSKEIDGYRFFWPYWNGKKYLTKKFPYKLCLFRREKISYLGIPHFTAIVRGKAVNSNLHLEHQPLYNNWRLRKTFPKQIRWAKIHANYLLKDFDQILKFNYKEADWPESEKIRIKYPLLLAPFIATYYLLGILKAGLWREIFSAYKIGIITWFYFLMVYIYVYKYKKSS